MTNKEIEELFGQVPYFADQVIEKAMPHQLQEDFVVKKTWYTYGSVNLLQVRGTLHPDYAGMTWRELLQNGRRMSGNLKLFRENPTYYTELQDRLPGMQFLFINGIGYVSEDGNHRTCIGKFFLAGQNSPFLHGVRFSEYVWDMHILKLFKSIQNKLATLHLEHHCQVTTEKKEVCRDDGDGWASHHYEIQIRLTNGTHTATFSSEQILSEVLPALHSPWLRRFGPYRHFFKK